MLQAPRYALKPVLRCGGAKHGMTAAAVPQLASQRRTLVAMHNSRAADPMQLPVSPTQPWTLSGFLEQIERSVAWKGLQLTQNAIQQQPAEFELEGDSLCLRDVDDSALHGPSVVLSSVLKKRRRKMNRHKYRKWRKRMKYVRRALGK